MSVCVCYHACEIVRASVCEIVRANACEIVRASACVSEREREYSRVCGTLADCM